MPGKKRQRSKDKPEKEPSQKRAAAAPVPLPSLAGMRGVVLRGEGGEPLSLFMRRAVEGNGRKVVILVDNGVDTSEILTAISRAGEISNHRERRCQDGDTTLPLIEVEFETEDAAKRCVNLQSKPPTTGPDGEPVGLKSACAGHSAPSRAQRGTITVGVFAGWLMEAESRSHMDEEELQREVDEFMEAFERRKEEVRNFNAFRYRISILSSLSMPSSR